MFHSVLQTYLDAAERARVEAAIERAAGRASRSAPLAWLGLDDPPGTAGSAWFELRLRTWPGGAERVLLRCRPHGTVLRGPV